MVELVAAIVSEGLKETVLCFGPFSIRNIYDRYIRFPVVMPEKGKVVRFGIRPDDTL